MCAAESRRLMLGELLLRAGVITEGQLRTGLAEQKKWGGKLGHLLVELNFLNEDTLVKALSKQLGIPRIEFEGMTVPQEALSRLNADFAYQNQILPISYDPDKNELVVVMSDPGDLDLVDELGFRTGSRIQVAIAGERVLSKAIREVYYSQAMSDEDQDAAIDLPDPLDNAVVHSGEPVEIQKAKDPLSKTVSLENKLDRLEALQRKQVDVLKAIVELLIEKGYVNREEYRRKVEP